MRIRSVTTPKEYLEAGHRLMLEKANPYKSPAIINEPASRFDWTGPLVLIVGFFCIVAMMAIGVGAMVGVVETRPDTIETRVKVCLSLNAIAVFMAITLLLTNDGVIRH